MKGVSHETYTGVIQGLWSRAYMFSSRGMKVRTPSPKPLNPKPQTPNTRGGLDMICNYF